MYLINTILKRLDISYRKIKYFSEAHNSSYTKNLRKEKCYQYLSLRQFGKKFIYIDETGIDLNYVPKKNY